MKKDWRHDRLLSLNWLRQPYKLISVRLTFVYSFQQWFISWFVRSLDEYTFIPHKSVRLSLTLKYTGKAHFPCPVSVLCIMGGSPMPQRAAADSQDSEIVHLDNMRNHCNTIEAKKSSFELLGSNPMDFHFSIF